MNEDELIGSRIKRARESAGLSQNGLAEMLKARGLAIPGQTVYKIEQGIRKVLAAELPIFGSALGLPAAALLGLGEERGPLLVAGSRHQEARTNLQAASLAYGRAMLAHAQAVDAADSLHPSDERFASKYLTKQTPAWVASANVVIAIEATLKLNRVTLTGTYSKAVMEALRADHDLFHGKNDG